MNTSLVEAFVNYASFCYREFGPMVRIWVTINEPNRLMEVYNGSAQDQEQVGRNLLLAHARAWNVYHTHFRQHQGAAVSLALHADWVEPANPFVRSHRDAVQSFMLTELGRFLDPFLRDDDHPDESPRPHAFHWNFSEAERAELKGALDFIALNHFTTRLVRPQAGQSNAPATRIHDHSYSLMYDPTWTFSNKGQALIPWGLRRVLGWVRDRYGNSHSIVTTATGIDDQASHDDQLRQTYIKSYLQEALKGEYEALPSPYCPHIKSTALSAPPTHTEVITSQNITEMFTLILKQKFVLSP